MNLAKKSTFRLTMEQSLCSLAILLAGGLFKWAELVGVLVMGGALVYLGRVNRELKTRREPLTTQQKHVVFAFLATTLGSVVSGLFVAALLKETALLWIAFGLASVYTGAALFFVHSDIYGHERRV